MKRVLLALVLVGGVAHADPASVLVADDDPELLHALKSSLAPYRFIVISDPAADDDPARISDVAKKANARFVVWREGGQLVVFDRESGSTERRPARGGQLSGPDAAAAALSVKTLMRLPADPNARPQEERPINAVERWAIRLFASGQLRSTGAGTEPTGGAGVAFRPRVDRGWRFGLVGEFSASSTVEKSGFKGTWVEQSVFAVISWAYEVEGSVVGSSPVLELEPYVAAGGVRGSLTAGKGSAVSTGSSDETSWMPSLRGGLSVWWTPNAFRIGTTMYVEGRASTPSYTKEIMGMGSPEVFAARSYAVGIGLVIGIELDP